MKKLQRQLLCACLFALSIAPASGASINVNNLSDAGTSGTCTLRQAITAANTNTAVGTCAAGSAFPTVDTINLSFSETFCRTNSCTVVLSSALPPITEDVTITSRNVPVTVSGADAYRIFKIEGVNVTISSLNLVNGSAEITGELFGGAVETTTAGGTLTLTDVSFSGNRARSGGGAVNLRGGTAVVDQCTFTGGSAQIGAAINQSGGVLIVSNSAFSNNTASSNGGGLYVFRSEARLTNVTFSGNHVLERNGGAIYISDLTTSPVTSVRLNNVTITNNTADMSRTGLGGGGGIFRQEGTVTVANSIIAGNFDTPDNAGPGAINADCLSAGSGGFTSFGYNVIGRGDGAVGFAHGTNGDKVGSNAAPLDPKLAPLAFNGGSTLNHSLYHQSPAMDGGSPAVPGGGGFGACAATDQRGVTRPIDGEGNGTAICDSGAVEVPLTTPTPTPTPTATPTPSATATPTPTATPSPTPTATPVPNRFANISTRLRVETGDNVLIGGFIVTGSMQKRIIVRALGPSLPLEDRLANPLLELFDANAQPVDSNDNWKDAANAQEISDSTIPPPDEFESAILRNVEPGAYTAVVRDVAGGEGVGLVEVYDLGSTQDSKLANIATRGRVLTGDNVMIGGLILTGSSPQKVIIRAIGPSLPVEGKLIDTFLELYDSNGVLLQSNDNWRDDQQAEIEATGIPPSQDAESAIVRNLAPAPYTAIVSGVNGAVGVALVEVYALH